MMDKFKSFIFGGFECADQINARGRRVDLLEETQHSRRVDEDYSELSELGILTVREGICWSRVEPVPGCYDFEEVLGRIKSAQKYGIEQIWDVVHFGYPADIYPGHPLFTARLVGLCQAFTSFYAQHALTRLKVVPINEISFISWLSGEVAGAAPFMRRNGWELKYQLCKAAIQGIKAIRSLMPTAEVFLVEPLIWVHAGTPADLLQADLENGYQFQTADIVTGRICPELGGDPSLIDGIGANYYWNCQWQLGYGSLPWPDPCGFRRPVSQLLAMVWERYGKPIFISETGHFGSGRALWISEIFSESLKALQMGVDLRGICLYPLVDRPDWDNLYCYHHSGLWDLTEDKDRMANLPYVEAIMDGFGIFAEYRKSLVGAAVQEIGDGAVFKVRPVKCLS